MDIEKHNQLQKLLQSNAPFEERLSTIAAWFARNYDTKVYFCKISAKRWEYIAGDKDIDIPEHRYQINEKTGMICGETTINQNTMQRLIDVLKKELII
mgnify:CR=1 FL=1